jgi:hypothetical protein
MIMRESLVADWFIPVSAIYKSKVEARTRRIVAVSNISAMNVDTPLS